MKAGVWVRRGVNVRNFFWGSSKMEGPSLREVKKELRQRVKAKLSKVAPEEVANQSSSITKQVLKMKEYQDAKAISIFLSMPGKEVSTQEIAIDALRNGKSVFIPYIHSGQEPKSKVIDMLQIRDEEDLMSLKPDSWGIPSLDAGSVDSRANALGGTGPHPDASPKLDLVFMPAVAFDRFHHRLGHGMGFYDRYLESYRSAVDQAGGNMPRLVGLALLQQLLQKWDKIPVDKTDFEVDAVVTPVAIM